MAESVVSFLLSKLTTLISQEYTLLKGFESEVRYIRAELGSMRAFLRIAEAKQDAELLNDEQKEWFKQVMEVAYDTEDIVDEFLLRFSHSGGAGFRGHVRDMYTSVKHLPAQHKITSMIIDIKKRVEEISDRHQRYQPIEGISETSSERISEHPIRGHGLLLEEADLVGIDGPKGKIISLIPTIDSNLKSIAVWGMGGLGKTTLVKRVFEAPHVKTAFLIHAWLTISKTFVIVDALKSLITQLRMDFMNVNEHQSIPVEVDSKNVDQLRSFVREFLKGKRYIIVLDDLWESNDWDSIKYVFPDDKCGSCILITTRKKDIAVSCCHEFRGIVHTMLPLSTNESWTLFCKKTFKDASCPPHLEDISNRILKKCEGLPVGIIVIGGLLSLKNIGNLDEWEMVLQSLGGELEINGKLDPIRKIIFLSYNDLPYYLKSCLLYMGIFPEDTEVYSYHLSHLWIAEGFVEERPGMTAMEVAYNYIKELTGRSLMQVAETHSEDWRISKCRVHDLIYNIILTKCEEYNIVATASTPNSEQPKENIRRLVFDESTFLKHRDHLLHLRSLITSQKSPLSLSDPYLSQLLKDPPKLLKVLQLRSSHLNIIPKEVFKLSNLTYLNLEKTRVTNIPRSIRYLQNLEYLNLLKTEVKELPDDIIMLKKLFYLGVSRKPEGYYRINSGVKATHGLGGLQSLHYLGYIEADSVEVIREIGKLTQLRELNITKIARANGRELCSSLERLTNLQDLTIQAIENQPLEKLDLEYSFSSTRQWQGLRSLYLGGGLVKIPDWVSSCHGLQTLDLDNSSLGEDPLGTLEGLPNLVGLYLTDAYLGDLLKFKAGGFPKLKQLELRKLSGLKLVTLEKGTLPCLEIWWIKICPLLEELPQDIKYLSKLQKVELLDMPERLQNNLRRLNEESDDYPKSSYYNEIIFRFFTGEEWKGDYMH